MHKLMIVAVSLGLNLSGSAGITLAQEEGAAGIQTNADGSYVTSTAGQNPAANGEGGTIIYGDITTGPGHTVIGPPSVVQTSPPPETVPDPAPEPVAETVPVATVAAPLDSAVATGADLDADNILDVLEGNLGLDPNNPDTDADGVADGDEINIYGTDAVVWDTDSDGISDGEELFGIQTDPLVWEDFSSETVETLAQEAASEPAASFEQAPEAIADQSLAQETSEVLTATDGNAATVGTGDASAAPGTVTRPGSSVLDADGTYSASDVPPANVTVSGNATVSGDTDVLSPPATETINNAPACGSYGSWYDAQVAYEAAGLTAADPDLVASLDPDYDGIACEEGM